MTAITNIQATDLVTNSRADINNNFANLNSGKIETSAIDLDTTLAANSDVKIPSQKAVKAYVDAGGNVNASTTQKGIVEQATDAEVLARTTTGGTGAPLFVNPSSLGQFVKFGGSGADGALAITTGTTTIDLTGLQAVVKNYSSISITGTGALAFSNPHANGTTIIFKCTGNVTITSSATRAVDLRSLGATGGAGATGSGAGSIGKGGGGGASISNNGADGATTGSGTAGAAGTIGTPGYGFATSGAGYGGATTSQTLSGGVSTLNFVSGLMPYVKMVPLAPGAGGGGGSSYNANGVGGDGGRGAGAFYIECGGSLNVTGTLDAGGIAGGNVTAGGGGGGGGGVIVILYTTLTANTGTFTVTGGAAGTGTPTGGAGGAGYTKVLANTDF